MVCAGPALLSPTPAHTSLTRERAFDPVDTDPRRTKSGTNDETPTTSSSGRALLLLLVLVLLERLHTKALRAAAISLVDFLDLDTPPSPP